MIETTPEPKIRKWNGSAAPFSVEYLVDVMEKIRAFVSKAPAGVETGGVLFGAHQDDIVRILAFRPITCDHAEGRDFHLSSNDRRTLLALLLSARHDEELSRLQPVGWFVSRADGLVDLKQSDISIANDFFSEAWQVTLVLAPAFERAMYAAFYLRTPDGAFNPNSTSDQFIIQPLKYPAIPTRWVIPKVPWNPEGVVSKLPWVLAGLLTLVIIGILLTPDRTQPVNTGFALHIQDTGSGFQIAWNPQSESIQAAQRGEIDISDGDRIAHVDLDAAHLRQGAISRRRDSSNVQVRMRIYGKGAVQMQEFANLSIKSIIPPPAPAVAAPNREDEINGLRSELAKERAASDRLKQTIKILENTISVDSSRKKP